MKQMRGASDNSFNVILFAMLYQSHFGGGVSVNLYQKIFKRILGTTGESMVSIAFSVWENFSTFLSSTSFQMIT